MKRDMELIRSLLLKVEGDENADLSKWSEAQQLYHYALLVEADLVHGETIEDENGEIASVITYRLTWNGHEFLDAARDNTVWDQAKARLAKVGGSVSLPVLTTILTELLKRQIGIP